MTHTMVNSYFIIEEKKVWRSKLFKWNRYWIFFKGKIWRKAFYSLGKICYECYGILYDKNGKEIYHGLLNNGKPKEGKSLIIYDDYRGELYRGDFSLFKYNGNGILYNSNGNIKFKGIFKDDQYLKGILYYDNGKVNFEGLFIDQHFKKGILYDEEGFKIYDGEFIDDKYNGTGILYYKKKNKMYFNGLFENNSFNKGKLYDPVEKIIYEGEFNNYYPKECKNIKLYYLEGRIKFEGDIINSQEKGKFYDYDDDSIFEGILEFGNKIKGSYYVNKIKK